MRLEEAPSLEVTDIDSGRMMIHVNRGKGAEDRLCSPATGNPSLIAYALTHRNPRLIFPTAGRSRQEAPRSENHMSISCVQQAVRDAIKEAPIHVSVHTMRHSYATHLLEAGVNLLGTQSSRGTPATRPQCFVLTRARRGMKMPY